jgi:hypothetical protein
MPRLTEGDSSTFGSKACKKKFLNGSIKGDSGNRERGSHNKRGLSGKNMHPSNVVRLCALYS